ncbi:OmpW family outer membrane protein [uncultured Salinisphaera sp.]|uniref:OmpW family outer membrane protein n=1 Tax=uncultured Salinisphaera sp. TaxID=359372 RepID=UPI0032B146DD|tara:strand:+ start:873 stop:1805 length:933 start_codon:yes stop_codon:yes gene_type:complete
MGIRKLSAGMRASAVIAGVVGISGLCFNATAAAQGQMRDMEAVGGDSLIGDAISFVGNNLYFRFGAGYLDYYGTSSELKVQDAQGLAAQAFGPGESSLDGTGTSVNDKLFPSGTLGLYIPWTNHHLATEVTISAPIKLDFQVDGAAATSSLAPDALGGNGAGNTIDPGVPTLNRNIGQLKTFPPNISFVYRPFVETRIQPYIGVGAMYLYTYDTDINEPLLNSVNEPTLYLSKPWACTGKLGFDINITEQFFVGAEAQYIGCAEVKAELNDISIRADNLSDTFGPVNVGTVSSTNSFEAVLYQLSMGVRF